MISSFWVITKKKFQCNYLLRPLLQEKIHKLLPIIIVEAITLPLFKLLLQWLLTSKTNTMANITILDFVTLVLDIIGLFWCSVPPMIQFYGILKNDQDMHKHALCTSKSFWNASIS